jgi:hypothetical protein
MTRVLYVLAALLLGHRFADDVRRLWSLYTADRAPLMPQPDDFVPRWMEAFYG